MTDTRTRVAEDKDEDDFSGPTTVGEFRKSWQKPIPKPLADGIHRAVDAFQPEVTMNNIRCREYVRETLQDMGLAIDQIWAMGDGDLAFFMRDKCDSEAYMRELHIMCGNRANFTDAQIYSLTPEQMIQTAVKAWNNKAADAAGDVE